MSGEPLLKFRVANLGKSACAVPIKVQKEVIGMLVVVRKEARPFEKIEQTLLEAVSDYASISLVNARLFRALKDSVRFIQTEARNGRMRCLKRSAVPSTRNCMLRLYPIDLLLTEKPGSFPSSQRQALQTSRAALQRLARAAEKTTPPIPIKLKKK